jgi:hypothetical protein
MKISNQAVTFVSVAYSIGASAQCTKPEINPIWDASKDEFRCTNPADTCIDEF